MKTHLSAFNFLGGRRSGALLLVAGLLAGCGLQKDVDVKLPSYDSELVLECYLQNGVVPSLTVIESVSYLGSVLPTVPTDVTVALTLPDGSTQPLAFNPNPAALRDVTLRDTVLNEKFHTHIGTVPVVARPGDVFTITAFDTRGRRVTGTATVPTDVAIDSVEYKFNDKTGTARKAYFLTNFRDPAPLGDTYRIQLHKGNPARGVLRRRPETDIFLEDRLNNGRSFTVGTSYRFLAGDTVTATLYHSDLAFLRFRNSLNNAANANGNPFAQPSAIYSTVQGGLGIFTVLNYQRLTKVVR